MARRIWLLTGLALAAVLVYIYGYVPHYSLEARVEQMAVRFFEAAAAGDLETVQTMVAPGAAVPAEEWVAQARGLKLSDAQMLKFIPTSPCGPIFVTAGNFWKDDGVPRSIMAAWRRADNGRFMVHTGPGNLCR